MFKLSTPSKRTFSPPCHSRAQCRCEKVSYDNFNAQFRAALFIFEQREDLTCRLKTDTRQVANSIHNARYT